MTAFASLRFALRRLGVTTALTGAALAFPLTAHAGAGAVGIVAPNTPSVSIPVSGVVISGSATIANGAKSVTVNQSTSKAIINWSAFSIATGNTVVFNQPNSSSATLNRVTGASASTIAGRISSNGAVYLVNPNGIAITASGNVQTGGGFIASTLDIANADFNAGKLAFSGKGSSKTVTNAGTITTGAGGYVALLGGSAGNSGTISVPSGKVALGSGESLALDLNGGGFLQVAVPSNLAGASVSNSGLIIAAGGRVEMKVASAASVVRNVINMTGTISADSAVGDGGSIVLLGGDGGTTSVTGRLSAKATGKSGNGGFVETSGAKVDFTRATISTSSAEGKAGTWLIDPTDLTVDDSAATTIQATLNGGTDVVLQTTATAATGAGNQSAGNGDITIGSAITWTSANTLSLLSYRNIGISAAISGTNGGLTITAGNGVANAGLIQDSTALAVKTFNLTNGAWSQTGTLPAFSATDFRFTPANASFLRATSGDGTAATPYLLTDVYGLQGIASSKWLNSSFKLANSIDASGTANWNAGAGFIAIGTDGAGTVLNRNGFTGNFNGQGFTIANLTINRPTARFVGLFGYVSNANTTISNIGLFGGSISGSHYVGPLVGYFKIGNLSNAFAATAVTAVSGIAGGVYGEHDSGTVTNVYATGSVSGGAGNQTGGLAGYEGGTISYAYATGAVSSTGTGTGGLVGNLDGSISNAYATGAVSSTGSSTGGLVGNHSVGSISNAYATGAVSGTTQVGGLIGISNGTVTNTYASGAVSGTGIVGGLIGQIAFGSVTNSYWDTYSNGRASAAGSGTPGPNVTGVTSNPTGTTAYKASSYTDFTTASGVGTATPSGFVFLAGNTTRPFLAFEVPNAAITYLLTPLFGLPCRVALAAQATA